MARFTPPTRWTFRNRILLMLGLLAFAFAGPMFAPWWERSDLDPRATIPLGFVGTWGAVLCWLTLLIWLLFFSYLPRKARLVLLVLFLAYLATIDDVQLDSYRMPILHHRWQARPGDALARYLDEQPPDPTGPPLDLSVDPVNDFPRYRGAAGDGVVHPTDLLDLKWHSRAPKVVWRHPCGGGFAGFAVAGNVAVTLEQREGEETIACYDRDSGRQRWAFGYEAAFRDVRGHGPRATPTIADGAVYSLGALGRLVCLDGATGKPRWQADVLDDAGAKNVPWGLTGSPLVIDGLVVVNAGIDPKNNAGRAVLAYRTSDGTVAWASGRSPAGYSSPLTATLAGRRQVVLFDNDGVAGYDLSGGAELWRFPWPMETDGNVTQPLILDGDRVFISSETNSGCAMLRVRRLGPDRFEADELWSNRNLCSRYANPIRLGESIFGLSSGYLMCLDVETGQRRWRWRECFRNGQLLGVAGAILVQSEDGELVSVAADPRKPTILGRFKVFDRRCWNTPALAGRRLYLRNEVEAACVELPLRK